MKRFILLLSVLFIGLSCSDNKEEEQIPENVLDNAKFTSVMIDVQLIEGMHAQGVEITSTAGGVDGAYEKVFEKHGITKEEFQASFSYYQEHPDKMEMIYEQVLDSLSKLDAEVKQRFSADRKAKTDSINEARLERQNNN